MQESTFGLLKKNILLSLIPLGFALSTCTNSNRNAGKKPIFLADREAPVGWSYLEIYEDSSFEFIADEYYGTVSIKNDTFHFNYEEMIPKVGKKAVIEGNYLIYVEGKYLEKLEIKLNQIQNKK